MRTKSFVCSQNTENLKSEDDQSADHGNLKDHKDDHFDDSEKVSKAVT